MRFSRTRLSGVLHVKACALARLPFVGAAKDVAPAHLTIECVTVGRFLLGLDIQLPLSLPDRLRGGWQHGNSLILRPSAALTKEVLSLVQGYVVPALQVALGQPLVL